MLDASSLPLQIEVKSAGAVPALATLFGRRPDDLQRVLFISFHDLCLVELADRLPTARLGVLRSRDRIFDLDVFGRLPKRNAAAFLPPVDGLEMSTIREFQRDRIRIGCWTIRDERSLEYAERAGVDMVTVSDPRRLRPVSVGKPFEQLIPGHFW